MSFKVGDVVCVLGMGQIFGSYSPVGKVCHLIDGNQVGVTFDRMFSGFHNCNGQCAPSSGYYFCPGSLVKMFPVKELLKSKKETI